MFKNTAAKFTVFAFDSTTNLPKTGDAANITAYYTLDNGSVTVLTDTSATEMDATNAKGYYLFDAAQAETNGDKIMVSAKSTTANIVVVGAPSVIWTRPATGWLAPTTAARTLDVSATGEAGVDWANVGSPTTSLALTGTTIATTQKVDIETIKTNPVVNGGTITFPTTATLASTTNITAGTIATVTNLTNAPTAGDLTATMKTSVTTAATAATPTISSVSGAVGSVTGAVGSVTGNVGGNVVGSVGSVTGLTASNLDAAITSRAAAGDAMALTSGERASTADVILARSLAAQSYAADGAVPTLSQCLYLIQQSIGDFSISGTTLTVNKLDGTTAAATYTLDDAVTPTSRTRAT